MKSKKFVLAGLALLAITGLLALAGCKNDSVPPEATSGTETKPVTHTVTFNADGGSEVAPQVVESGQTATRPEPDPTKANRVFAGWYTLKDDGETLADTAYSFDTPVEGDIILYAAWNGRDSDGNIVLKNKVMSKTSEVKVLPTGTFQMGSTAGYGDEKPVHGVTISKGYFMGRHEVT